MEININDSRFFFLLLRLCQLFFVYCFIVRFHLLILIWFKLLFVQSRGLYSRTNTEVATSGCESVRSIDVRPAIGMGGHTGVRSEFPSRDISNATADGQAAQEFK